MSSAEPQQSEPANFEQHELLRQCWLHVHVPKAGGSTLRQLMNRNFGERYNNSKSLLETKQYTREDISEIVRCHPHLGCLSDHKFSLDLPWDHEHAQLFALSYVRDPVERFISRYFFHRHFEEISCVAQRMSFRDFAETELISEDVHPQTNSQVYFLNGGHSFDDLSVVHDALATERAFLFPIERFDESCICMERLFPTVFSDLSYVRANVSKKDAEILEDEREMVRRYLKQDYPVMELAEQFLEKTLQAAFHSDDDRKAALHEFQDRCSRRYHNFYPPVKQGEPVPPIGTIPTFPKASSQPSQPTPPSKPSEPTQPAESSTQEPIPPVEKKETLPTLETLPQRPEET